MLEDKAKLERITADFYAMQARDLRTAILGADSIDQDEKTALDGFRTGFNQPDFGAFKLEQKQGRREEKFWTNRSKNWCTCANGTDYDKNFKAELDAALAKIKHIEGKTAAEIVKHEVTARSWSPT